MRSLRTLFTHTALCAAFALVAGCASGPMASMAPAMAPLPASTPPASAVYIGNSFFYFNNGIISHMSGLINAGMPGFRHRQSMITISGSGSDWHDVGSYFRPNAVGKYSFDAENNVVMNKIDRLFDVAVMMDCSQCPIHPQMKTVFESEFRKNSDIVRRQGARPVYFASWAYKDKPEMAQQLSDAYTAAAKANGAQVIPAGLAFARSIALRPEVDLYIADKRHPSVAGTYLAACTTYATLFQKSPVGSSYTAGLDPQLARHLQTVAWDTVQAYRQP